MQNLPKTRFTYLCLAPYISDHQLEERVHGVSTPKDAPYFFELDIQYTTLPEFSLEIDGVKVEVFPQVVDGTVWMVECNYSLSSTFDASIIEKKQRVNRLLRKKLLDYFSYTGNLVEEFTVVLVQDLPHQPEKFVNDHLFELAKILRASKDEITREQAEFILKSRIRYGKNDLTIIDWEGALVIASEDDFQTELELMKIGNYQLLRYRMLDAEIQTNLELLHSIISRRVRWFPQDRQTISSIVSKRLQFLINFESTNQSLLLIGDWYPSQLYRVIVEEFYIDKWKTIVTDKLDSLSAIDATVRENLSISWSRVIDFVQIAGWMILLIGYFVLFYHDLSK